MTAYVRNSNLCAVLEVELGEDGADVVADRALAHARGGRDLFVVQTFGDELNDLVLAVGERSERSGAGGANVARRKGNRARCGHLGRKLVTLSL